MKKRTKWTYYTKTITSQYRRSQLLMAIEETECDLSYTNYTHLELFDQITFLYECLSIHYKKQYEYKDKTMKLVPQNKTTRLNKISFHHIVSWFVANIESIPKGKTLASVAQLLNETEALANYIPLGGITEKSAPSITRTAGYKIHAKKGSGNNTHKASKAAVLKINSRVTIIEQNLHDLSNKIQVMEAELLNAAARTLDADDIAAGLEQEDLNAAADQRANEELSRFEARVEVFKSEEDEMSKPQDDEDEQRINKEAHRSPGQFSNMEDVFVQESDSDFPLPDANDPEDIYTSALDDVMPDEEPVSSDGDPAMREHNEVDKVIDDKEYDVDNVACLKAAVDDGTIKPTNDILKMIQNLDEDSTEFPY